MMDLADREEKMITITEKEYDRLIDDSAFLGCLFAGGVDNWEGYELALEEHEENRGEKY